MNGGVNAEGSCECGVDVGANALRAKAAPAGSHGDVHEMRFTSGSPSNVARKTAATSPMLHVMRKLIKAFMLA